MRKWIPVFVAAALFLPACHGGTAPHATSTPVAQHGALTPVAELPLPDVPATLREPAERAAYIIGHFWDAMDFGDTLRSRDVAFMEQNFSNFISVFPYADDEAQRLAVGSLLKRAEADREAYVLLADIAEKYLYEPTSPMLAEDVYILFLDELVCAPLLGDGTARLRWQLDAARKNRPGMSAADFSFTTRSGRRSTLHCTAADAPRLLLLFYDPECDHCHEVMADLQHDRFLQGLVADGQLSVLALYSGDDCDHWQSDAATLPSLWIVGYETGTLQENGSYVLRAMPTLYLLDRGGKVILKDVQLSQLMHYLQASLDEE